MGAKRGLFLSTYQRSLHNAATKLRARPWWSVEETSYQSQIRYVFVSTKLWLLKVLTLRSRISVLPLISLSIPYQAPISPHPLIDFSFLMRKAETRGSNLWTKCVSRPCKRVKLWSFFRGLYPKSGRAIVNVCSLKTIAFYVLKTTICIIYS